MLSTAADLMSVAQAAPWLAVVVVCLVVVFWVYRQGRKSLAALEAKVARSARAQGERIGDLEQHAELERTRRMQLEDELLRRGVDLPWWPPDGDRPRPLPTAAPLLDREQDYTTEAPLPPVPQFTDEERERLARHRR